MAHGALVIRRVSLHFLPGTPTRLPGVRKLHGAESRPLHLDVIGPAAWRRARVRIVADRAQLRSSSVAPSEVSLALQPAAAYNEPPALTAPNKSLPSGLELMVVIHQTSVKLSKKCKVCGELVRPDEMARHRRDSTELHVQLLEDMLEACSAHTNP